MRYPPLPFCELTLIAALIRDISKLSGTALIADFFIMLGLIVLYYFDISTLATEGMADIQLFNPNDFVLFLGTAAFAFEGIGLVIPIQESMARPEKFKFVLTGVMIILILVFTSIGGLSYAAYGSDVKTVIISSLPQDSGPLYLLFVAD
jgi:solute carrier family 36 (proton-coupled amino acid transporter)